jgi:hypothetical protein
MSAAPMSTFWRLLRSGIQLNVRSLADGPPLKSSSITNAPAAARRIASGFAWRSFPK